MTLGDVGVYSGMRKGGQFGITSSNIVHDLSGSMLDSMIQNLLYIIYTPMSYKIRETLQSCPNYKCAETKLKTATINTPGRIMILGVDNEGVEIERDRRQITAINEIN